jgi:hypothetical protein
VFSVHSRFCVLSSGTRHTAYRQAHTSTHKHTNTQQRHHDPPSSPTQPPWSAVSAVSQPTPATALPQRLLLTYPLAGPTHTAHTAHACTLSLTHTHTQTRPHVYANERGGRGRGESRAAAPLPLAAAAESGPCSKRTKHSRHRHSGSIGSYRSSGDRRSRYTGRIHTYYILHTT